MTFTLNLHMECMPLLQIRGEGYIGLDKSGYFSYFSMKTYVVGTHEKRITEALLMSTHNICFCRELRKISVGYGSDW